MNNTRAPRPSPRTLSADPPTATRVPQSATYQARFPSLVAAIASGALVPACYDVECGTTRAQELDTHGMRAIANVQGGHAGQAITEIGVALGIASHTSTTRPLSAGGMRAATPETPPQQPPPPPVEPQIITQGEPVPVGPTPVDVEPPHPTPPTTTRPTHVNPTAPHSQPTPPRSQIRGGARRVDPQPRSGGDISAVGPLPHALLSPSNRRV